MSDHDVQEMVARDVEHAGSIRRVTWAGLLLNILLSGVKLAGGIVGNSQAVVADAVHSLSDISTDVGILLGMRHWSKPADETHPHGHRRLELLVTLGIGAVLVVVAVGLAWNAVTSVGTGSHKPPGWAALAAALVSIVSKEGMYRWTVSVGRELKCMPLVANAWHHRSDALSSLPVAAAVAGAAFGPGWAILDPLGAALVSVFIFQAAFRILGPVFSKLIDTAASEEVQEEIRSRTLGTSGVNSVHKLRTRYLDSSAVAVDLHIQVEGDMSVRRGHDIAEDVKQRLTQMDDVVDVVVHIEPLEDEQRRRAEAGEESDLQA